MTSILQMILIFELDYIEVNWSHAYSIISITQKTANRFQELFFLIPKVYIVLIAFIDF